MAYDKQLFIGKLSSVTPKYDNVIALNGDTTSGQPSITNAVAIAGFDLALLRVGQTINTIAGGGFSSDVTITNVSGTTITVNTNAAATQTGGTFTVDMAAGVYFFSSASFLDPQGVVNVNSITGSTNLDYDATLSPIYSILGQAASTLGGSVITGKYHYYKITDVTSRDLGGATISAFVGWGEVGSESDSGDFLYAASSQGLAIGAFSTTASQMTIFGDDYLTGLGVGADVAPYQIALPQVIDHTGSDGGGVAAFPFTGSAGISGSIDMTGSFSTLLNSSENFLIKNALATTQSLFQIDNEGTAIFRARDGGVSDVPSAVVGGLYFSTSSAFIGVDGV